MTRPPDPATIDFVERVRALYVESFSDSIAGDDVDDENDHPMIGTVLISLAIQHLDGEMTNISLYDGSWIEAVGLARIAIFNLLPE